MNDAKNEYIAKTKKNLDLLEARLVELETSVKQKRGAVQQELKEKLDAIRASKIKMERRLVDMRLASKPAWEDIKQGAEEAWDQLERAVDKAAERFQSDAAGTSGRP
jgi:recombinational DNA repair ATPase RecF